MSILGDITGFIDTGRAGKSISDSNIAAEHGVLDQQTNANTNVPAAGAAGNKAVSDAANSANTKLSGALASETSNLTPYLTAGQKGVQGLSDYAASKPSFSFTPGDLANDPGYQFQLKQGQEAIQNSAASKGLLSSGNTLKDLTTFGTGLAGTYYNDAFSRAKTTFDTNQNATLANLGTLTNAGLSASQQFNTGTTGLTSQQANNDVGAGVFAGNTDVNQAGLLAQLNSKSAVDAGNFAVGAGDAHAAGILGQGNALSNLGGDVVGGITAGLTGGFGAALPSIFGGGAAPTLGGSQGSQKLPPSVFSFLGG